MIIYKIGLFSFSPNPVTLGTRWLAYAERKLLPSKRSSGGCDGDGVASYRANFLNAAKSLGKGLRELGEQMAAGFTGTGSPTLANSSNSTINAEDIQPGVVTIMDTKVSLFKYDHHDITLISNLLFHLVLNKGK